MYNEIDLSPKALKSFEALAADATPGPWTVEYYKGGPYPGPWQIWHFGEADKVLVSISVEGKKNAEYIAAIHPGVIRALCGEVKSLRGEVARLNKEAEWLAQAAANNGWNGVRVSPASMREQARKAVEAINAE